MKKSFKINYDFPGIAWLRDPPANEVISIPWQAKPYEFGLWKKSTKRPTSDKFFTLKQGSSDESKESSLSCPPASCADPNFRMLLELSSFSLYICNIGGVLSVWRNYVWREL